MNQFLPITRDIYSFIYKSLENIFLDISEAVEKVWWYHF